MHVRQKLREAAASAVMGLSTTGPRVFENRTVIEYGIPDAQLPCLIVYSEGESVDLAAAGRKQGGARLQQREVDLKIVAVAKKGDDVEDLLDTIAEEVEGAVLVDRTLGGLARDTQLTGLQTMFGTSQQTWGAIQLTFTTGVITREGEPDRHFQN